jgi:hypothetical protein
LHHSIIDSQGFDIATLSEIRSMSDSHHRLVGFFDEALAGRIDFGNPGNADQNDSGCLFDIAHGEMSGFFFIHPPLKSRQSDHDRFDLIHR